MPVLIRFPKSGHMFGPFLQAAQEREEATSLPTVPATEPTKQKEPELITKLEENLPAVPTVSLHSSRMGWLLCMFDSELS